MSRPEKFPIIPNDAGLSAKIVERKRKNEKITFLAMACLYCNGNHHKGRVDCRKSEKLPSDLQLLAQSKAKKYPHWRRINLCPDCLELVTHVEPRTTRCPHMAYKSFCHLCPRPCHPPKEMALISPLMRYSGPRLLFHYPILTARHIREVMRSKKIIQRHRESSYV